MKTELALYQALISINVPEEKANAVIEALEADMLSRLATKTDLTAATAEVKIEIAQFDAKIAEFDSRLTIRMGLMLSASVGVLITSMKLLSKGIYQLRYVRWHRQPASQSVVHRRPTG